MNGSPSFAVGCVMVMKSCVTISPIRFYHEMRGFPSVDETTPNIVCEVGIGSSMSEDNFQKGE